MAAGEVAVGDDQRLAGLVGRDGSSSRQISAHRVGNIGPEKDETVVVFAVHQQCPAVAMALQVGDVGTRDLHRTQRLQAQQTEQRAIAQVLGLVIVWNSTKQQR